MIKNLLYIGSESYDAPTITVLQGLQEMGWNIYTLNKPNVNSWFCNKVVDESSLPEIRFVLSNLHWGTRWSNYDKLGLLAYKKVLIDGDDDPNVGDWYQKYLWHCRRYPVNPPLGVRDAHLSPYRWMERLGNYQPDYVFCAQKHRSDPATYLPFGIHREYYDLAEHRHVADRQYAFAHFPGPGRRRRFASRAINVYNHLLRPSPRIWNASIRGDIHAPASTQQLISQDQNIHSWHRWTLPKGYFRILNQTRVLIYPGVDHWPYWESKRPYEAIASGAAVLLQRPTIDTQGRGLETIDSDFVFDGWKDLLRQVWRLSRLEPADLYTKVDYFVGQAQARFSAASVARFFLETIGEADAESPRYRASE